MARTPKKTEDLGYIRLICTKGCGLVRRDAKNDVNFPITKVLLKKFNVSNPMDLQKVYVCKSCQKGKERKKDGNDTPISNQEVGEKPQTTVQNDNSNIMNFEISQLVPQNEISYVNRKICGKNDVNILDEAYQYNLTNSKNGSSELFNVLLVGECGSGKTHFARHFAYKKKLPYKRINLNGATTPEDLIGQFVPNGSERTFKWVDGWLTRFMRNGGVFVLDEINMAHADILAILNSVLDSERTLVITQKDGEVVKANQKFFCIATMNLNYEGTKPLNEALKDRFTLTLDFEYDSSVEEKLITNKTILTFAEKLRISYSNQEIVTPISTRTLIAFQRNIKTFGKNVAERILFNRFDKLEQKVVKEIWKTLSTTKQEAEKQEKENAIA